MHFESHRDEKKNICCQSLEREKEIGEEEEWQYFMSRIATISSVIKTHLNSLPHRFIVIINSLCVSRRDEHK